MNENLLYLNLSLKLSLPNNWEKLLKLLNSLWKPVEISGFDNLNELFMLSLLDKLSSSSSRFPSPKKKKKNKLNKPHQCMQHAEVLSWKLEIRVNKYLFQKCFCDYQLMVALIFEIVAAVVVVEQQHQCLIQRHTQPRMEEEQIFPFCLSFFCSIFS